MGSLCAKFLNAKLEKNPSDRLSQCSSVDLRPSQLFYAAMDVIVARAVLKAIRCDASPLLMSAPSNSEELIGQSVWLLSPLSPSVVAVGNVVRHTSENWGRNGDWF